MKVTYTPQPGDERVVTYCGVEFFAGQAQDIDPEDHPHLAKKVVTNPHFTVTGAPAASEPDQKPDVELDVLRTEASLLGIKVDGRWGADKLRAEIAAKKD